MSNSTTSQEPNESQPPRKTWAMPQLVPLDLGSAQAKFCRFSDETAPDNGPKMGGSCSAS